MNSWQQYPGPFRNVLCILLFQRAINKSEQKSCVLSVYGIVIDI